MNIWRKGDPTPDNWPQWLKEADIGWCRVSIEQGTVTWHDGVWNDGTWKSGVWCSGDWYGGVWESGIWKDGTWLGGTWYCFGAYLDFLERCKALR